MKPECPLPRYWLCHICVALTIAVVVWTFAGLQAGLIAGAMFYVGREYTQWESGLPFDWKGLCAPTSVCFVAWCIFKFINS